MKRFRIRLLDKADAQLDAVASWWRGNRQEHPDLVFEELEEVEQTLALIPEAGEEVPRRRGARRALLPRSQYWVYYRVDEDARAVVITALWHAARGKGPPLR